MNAAVHSPERLISVDSHVHFTDEWVKARLPARLHPVWDQAARTQGEYEAAELRRGQKNLELEDFVDPEAARDPGHFEPHAKLKAMDRDGVQAEVIFPEVGGAKYCTPRLMGTDWQEALSGYNDGMADFAAVDPLRLLTAYQIQLFDVDFAVQEVRRLAKRGARCVQITPFPTEQGLPDVHDRRYDPLWAELADSQITILNHLDLKASTWDVFRRDPTPQKGIFTAMPAMMLAEPLAFWILTGTLERFPKLRVLLVEPGLGWLPYFFETILDPRMHQHYEFPGVKLLPSEYFKRQMGATFMYEPTGLGTAYRFFGPDCLYWSTDFPHPATCWPNSRRVVEEQFDKAGVPQADRRKIVSDNALRLFGLPI
ncbi:MAG: amidohydrolase [Proteobacteria bacterium]|nr:amidohydrolase [Pseudomonadota bacterium]